jgi:hypothetical protein
LVAAHPTHWPGHPVRLPHPPRRRHPGPPTRPPSPTGTRGTSPPP